MTACPVKMQTVAVPLQGLISVVKNNTNTLVLSVLVFSYQALEHEFPCSCQPQPGYCWLYMILPCLIVTTLMLSTDLPFQRAWRFTTSQGSSHFFWVLFRRIVKAFCVGLLWAASVLIDAEWFVCCCNQNPKEVADLQCKAKTEITPGGTPVVTIAEMKMTSRALGMCLLFGITMMGAIFLSTWTICCPDYYRRDIQVHELILEVGEDIVSKTMKEKQRSKLSEKVNEYIADGKWVSCLDVVEEFIDTIGEKEKSYSDQMTQAPSITELTTQPVDNSQQGDEAEASV